MNTYTLYIHDRRYSVPTLLAMDFVDDEHARTYAASRLAGSQHYTAIEIWRDDTLVFDVRNAA